MSCGSSGALEKLRRDRKQLEELEAKVLAAPVDAQEMHAWAARELRVLSDSIRQSKTATVEMKTARPLLLPSVSAEPRLPVLSLPNPDKLQAPLVHDPKPLTEERGPTSVPSTREAEPTEALEVDELFDDLVEPSESVRLPVAATARRGFVDNTYGPTTARRPAEELVLSNHSSMLKSVSLDDDSVFRDLRTCSPHPLSPDPLLSEWRPSRDPHPLSPHPLSPACDLVATESPRTRAQRVLNEFVMTEKQRDANLRAELGHYAQSKLGLGALAKADRSEALEIPPLAKIERQTKNGVAMSFDFR